MLNHMVRIEACGTIGCYQASDDQSFDRGMRVVCHTERGLEVGEVLAHVAGEHDAMEPDGQLVRAYGGDDDQRFRRCAVQRKQVLICGCR